MTPTTPCPACGGTGQAKLSAPLARTLKRLGKRKLTANQLAEPGLVHGAIVNRLTKLEKLGLVTRIRKDDKSVVWGRANASRDTTPPEGHTCETDR